MSTRTKICPVCEYAQDLNDPTRHVCSKVLREKLHEARAKLSAISALVDDEDVVAGVRLLRQEHDAAPAAMEACILVGHRRGVKHAIGALQARIMAGSWIVRLLLAGQYRLLCNLRVPTYSRLDTDDR